MAPEDLIKKAREVQVNSYSPYSGFAVGAALLTKNGNIFTGTNVENASYGLTVCAERIAAFSAVSKGERDFEAIAVCGSGTGFVYPCGACLQVLAEFSPQIEVLAVNETNEYKRYLLHDLIPMSFALNTQEV